MNFVTESANEYNCVVSSEWDIAIAFKTERKVRDFKLYSFSAITSLFYSVRLHVMVTSSTTRIRWKPLLYE